MEVRDFKSAEHVLNTHVSIIRFAELPFWYVAPKIIINAENGILVEKEGILTLIWTTEEKTFHIIGEMERAEIIEMAESLKYFSK